VIEELTIEFYRFIFKYFFTVAIDVSTKITSKIAECFKDAGVVHFITHGLHTKNSKVDKNVCKNLEIALAAGIETIGAYAFFNVSNGDLEAQLNNMINYMTKNCPTILKKARIFLDIEKELWYRPNTKGYDSLNRKLYKNLIDATTKHKLSFGVYVSRAHWEEIFKISTFNYGNKLPLWLCHYDHKENLDDFKPFGGWTKADVILKQHTKDSKKYCHFNADLNWDPTWE